MAGPFPDQGDPRARHRQPPPRAARLNRRVLYGTAAIGTGLLLLAGYGAFGPKDNRKSEAAEQVHYGNTASPLATMPAGYPPVRPVAAPRPPDVPPPPVMPQVAPAASPPQHTERGAPKPPRKIEMAMVDNQKGGKRNVQDIQLPETPPGEPTPVAAQPKGFLAQAAQPQTTTLKDALHQAPSPYAVLAGTVIPASLIRGIENTLPGGLLARVRQRVCDTVEGAWELIPQGAMLLGVYNSETVYGEDRVLIAWQRLILPDGTSIQLEGMEGMDLTGMAGLKDQVDNHLWPLFRAVVLSSLLSVGARAPFGDVSGYNPSLAQQYAQQFGESANQAGQSIVNRELRRKQTLRIRQGMSLDVFAHKDMVLRPYLSNGKGGRC